MNGDVMKERIQKIMSAYGIASRRKSEAMIANGLVAVNGAVAKLGDTADPEVDTITIDGKPLVGQAERICIALNKPRGYLTTVYDDRGRKTVMQLVSGISERIYPAGRLDMYSSGLLIMTNDGNFANKIMHPINEKDKTYLVRIKGDILKALPILNSAMLIDGYRIRPAKINIIRNDGTTTLLRIIIHEGRNRQIRKMCQSAGVEVVSLHRVSIGNIQLGDLPTGKWRYLTEDEINSLY